jgi:hypothetical protein
MTLSTRETDATFTDLICADQQWLREEFDALIAASFDEPPVPPPPTPPPPTPRRVPPRPGHPGPPSWRPAPGPVATTFPVAGPAHGRQRSPPASPAVLAVT